MSSPTAPKVYGIVYRVLCIPSGKSYVGQTIRTLGQRWTSHKCAPLGGALRNAIEKYGSQSFTRSIIDTATNQEELDEKERHWIRTLNTLSPNGYNLEAGGDTGWSASPETREKMRQAKLAVAHTPEFLGVCKLGGQGNKGKKKSPEHIAAASKANLEARARNGFKRVCTKPRADKGVPRSPEVKARMKAAREARQTEVTV